MKSHLTAVALAVALAMTPPASAKIYKDPSPPDPNSPQAGVRLPDSSPGYTVFDNTPISVTIQTPVAHATGFFAQFVGAIRDYMTGARDLGDWYCGSCSVSSSADANSWTAFITNTVNPTLGSGPNGRWRIGDRLAICDGSGTCVIVKYHGYLTDAWYPSPADGPVTKKDKGKYKNQQDVPPPTPPAANNRATPVFDPNGTLILWLITADPPPPPTFNIVVHVGPLEPVPPDVPVPLPGVNGTTDPGNFGGDCLGDFPGFNFGGGGWGGGGGGGCVHVDSILPDGRRAGDMRVGDLMMLGDEQTAGLDTLLGEVTYSQEKTEPGFRITTSDGISLVCSASAPIWTDEGYVLAPLLLGKRVATRLDDGQATTTNFKIVEQVESVGPIQVQHITVGNRAFWAGETHGAYVLHHNEKVTGDSF